MAGSSVPLAERRPPMELPTGGRILEAVSIHGGPVEIYDFHGLEVLQSLVESRQGGEPGVAQVRFLEGDALWDAADAGLWSPRLADAAMAAELGPDLPTLRELVRPDPFDGEPTHGILLTYRDGFRRSSSRSAPAAPAGTSPAPSTARTPPGDELLRRPLEQPQPLQGPVPRDPGLLPRRAGPPTPSSGPCSRRASSTPPWSRGSRGASPSTPPTWPSPTPRDYRAMREMGATWKILTPDTPQPPGIDTSGRRH